MKLLLDQNLSYKLIKPLSTYYEEVTQIGRVGMGQSVDAMVWQYALTFEYVIITTDIYFSERNAITGYPLKVIWLKCKDLSTKNIIHVFGNNMEAINIFFANKELSCLEITDM